MGIFILSPQGLRVRLKVTPRASHSKIIGVFEDVDGHRLKVSVTAVAEDGKANEAVIALLHVTWGIRKSDMEIIVGQGSTRKVLLIKGGDLQLEQRLSHTLRLSNPGCVGLRDSRSVTY